MSNPEIPSASRRFPLFPVTIVILLLALALFGDKGILRAYQYHRHKQSLEEEIRKLESTSADLRREIEALRDELRTIEGIARRELGMVKEDELVYQFRSSRGPSPVPRPSTVAGVSEAADAAGTASDTAAERP